MSEDMILVHRTLIFQRLITIKLKIFTYFPLYISSMRLKISLIWASGRISWLPEPVMIFFSSGLMLLSRRLLQTVLIPLAPVKQKSFKDSAWVLRFCNDFFFFAFYLQKTSNSQLNMVDETRRLTLYNSFYLKQIILYEPYSIYALYHTFLIIFRDQIHVFIFYESYLDDSFRTVYLYHTTSSLHWIWI